MLWLGFEILPTRTALPSGVKLVVEQPAAKTTTRAEERSGAMRFIGEPPEARTLLASRGGVNRGGATGRPGRTPSRVPSVRPLPVRDLGPVGAVLVRVAEVVEDRVLHVFLQVRGLVAQARHA